MQTEKPNIVVVGSLNMDLVTRTQRRPQRGEPRAAFRTRRQLGGSVLMPRTIGHIGADAYVIHAKLLGHVVDVIQERRDIA